ncbi:hypothetical protein KCU95_g3192, partial [Aureobasidium melanogenum]
MANNKRSMLTPPDTERTKRTKNSNSFLSQAESIAPPRQPPFPKPQNPSLVTDDTFPDLGVITEAPPKRALPFAYPHKRGESGLEKRFEAAMAKAVSSQAEFIKAKESVSAALAIDGGQGHSPEYVAAFEQIVERLYQTSSLAAAASKELAIFVNKGDRFDIHGIYRRSGPEDPPRRPAPTQQPTLPTPAVVAAESEHDGRVSPIQELEPELNAPIKTKARKTDGGATTTKASKNDGIAITKTTRAGNSATVASIKDGPSSSTPQDGSASALSKKTVKLTKAPHHTSRFSEQQVIEDSEEELDNGNGTRSKNAAQDRHNKLEALEDTDHHDAVDQTVVQSHVNTEDHHSAADVHASPAVDVHASPAADIHAISAADGQASSAVDEDGDATTDEEL